MNHVRTMENDYEASLISGVVQIRILRGHVEVTIKFIIRSFLLYRNKFDINTLMTSDFLSHDFVPSRLLVKLEVLMPNEKVIDNNMKGGCRA